MSRPNCEAGSRLQFRLRWTLSRSPEMRRLAAHVLSAHVGQAKSDGVIEAIASRAHRDRDAGVGPFWPKQAIRTEIPSSE